MKTQWTAVLRSARVAYGAGSLETLGEESVRMGGTRVLLVTDPGIRDAGHVDRATDVLSASGVATSVFDGVEPNPTEECVRKGVEAAKSHRPDLILGLGGGSAMDCAKGVNLVFTNGGRMEDYLGFGRAELPLLPSIGVPCTAGTGSEAQSFALISRNDDHHKMACGDEKARFGYVALDPEVARTAPPEVVAITGLDALSHAVESLVTSAGNPFSRMRAIEAWRHLDRCYERLTGQAPADDEVWGEMLLGAHMAGAAIEASMLGAAHAMANPVTAAYDVTHGVAVGIALPTVVRYNGEVSSDLYARLEGVDGAESLASRLETLRAGAGLPSTWSEVGVREEDLKMLADQAAEQWTAGFNPRAVGASELLALYRSSFA